MSVYEYARKKSERNTDIRVHTAGFIGLRVVVQQGACLPYKQRYYNFRDKESANGMISREMQHRLRIEAELLNETWIYARDMIRANKEKTRNLKYNFYVEKNDRADRAILRICIQAEKDKIRQRKAFDVSRKHDFRQAWANAIVLFHTDKLITDKKADALAASVPDFDAVNASRLAFNKKHPHAAMGLAKLKQIYGDGKNKMLDSLSSQKKSLG